MELGVGVGGAFGISSFQPALLLFCFLIIDMILLCVGCHSIRWKLKE